MHWGSKDLGIYQRIMKWWLKHCTRYLTKPVSGIGKIQDDNCNWRLFVSDMRTIIIIGPPKS